MPDTIVVVGSGKAAASTLNQIDWIADAEHLVYWGVMDADGFAILDNLRAALTSKGVLVESILMDDLARARYAQLGVARDKRGDVLKPSKLRL
ncbi:Wadjet anti-phage system protein JetD domain-containing protein, partial [Salinibacterium amurskyense]|uniref:Wadjet anti-phage system protein JetD domain-containing protein n=1 Tax=Salinibacterium amurskyense TaxID=205941 RepID=UPI00311D9268